MYRVSAGSGPAGTAVKSTCSTPAQCCATAAIDQPPPLSGLSTHSNPRLFEDSALMHAGVAVAQHEWSRSRFVRTALAWDRPGMLRRGLPMGTRIEQSPPVGIPSGPAIQSRAQRSRALTGADRPSQITRLVHHLPATHIDRDAATVSKCGMGTVHLCIGASMWRGERSGPCIFERDDLTCHVGEDQRCRL